MCKKILIADSHPIVINGVMNLLKEFGNEIRCVEPVTDISKIWNSLSLYTPDLLIMELSLPNSKGIETIQKIKKHSSFLRIVVYSAQYNNLLALKSIKAGASGFICKTMDLNTVKDAIERILKGGIYLSEELRDQLNDENSSVCKIVI